MSVTSFPFTAGRAGAGAFEPSRVGRGLISAIVGQPRERASRAEAAAAPAPARARSLPVRPDEPMSVSLAAAWDAILNAAC